MNTLTIIAGISGVLGFALGLSIGAPIESAFIAGVGVLLTSIACCQSNHLNFQQNKID